MTDTDKNELETIIESTRRESQSGKGYYMSKDEAINRLQALITQQCNQARIDGEKRGYSKGYNAAMNKELNRVGHNHTYVPSPNQDDTGTAGVRMVCDICKDEQTVYDEKLHAELQAQAKETE